MDDEGIDADIKTRNAARYGEWVLAQMRRQNWDQATLARRAFLKKQTVGTIIHGAAMQPTAAQVANIARAFRVPPTAVLEAMGLWEDGAESSEAVPADVASLWAELDPLHQEAASRHVRVVRELQAEYESQQEPRVAEEPTPYDPDGPASTDNLAAADEDSEQYRQAQGWIDEDPP